MTSKEEKSKFAGKFSQDEWRILASNPRFLNALDESTGDAMTEAQSILDTRSRMDKNSMNLFPPMKIKKSASVKN